MSSSQTISHDLVKNIFNIKSGTKLINQDHTQTEGVRCLTTRLRSLTLQRTEHSSNSAVIVFTHNIAMFLN